MKLKRILLSFCRYAAAVLIVFGRSIVQKMTDNGYFTDPEPKLIDVTAAIDKVEELAALAKDGSNKDNSNLKKAKNKLIELLRSRAWYVGKKAKRVENIFGERSELFLL